MSRGNKLASENAKEFRVEQREAREKAIDEAIRYLRESGLPVTKKAIAEELGCHVNTLQQPYMRDILLRYEEFQQSAKTEKDVSMLEQRIKKLENILSHSRNYNARLTSENERLRRERDEYEDRYRRLLGRYQVDVGKMKIGF